MKRRISIGLLACALTASGIYAVSAQTAVSDGPTYAAGTSNLIRPADYREWIFVGSSIGLNYPPPGAPAGPQMFHNVFVNPSSYRSFMRTGKWPDKTVLILEMRGAGRETTANRDGTRMPVMPGTIRSSHSYGPCAVSTTPQTRTSGPNDRIRPASAMIP